MPKTQPLDIPPDLVIYHPRHTDTRSDQRWTYYVVHPGRSRTSEPLWSLEDVQAHIRTAWAGKLPTYRWSSLHYIRTHYGRRVDAQPYPEGQEAYRSTYLPGEGVILLHPDLLPAARPLNVHEWRAQKAAERRALPRMVLWYRTSPNARPIHHVLRQDGTITGPLVNLSEVRRELRREYQHLEPAPNQPLDYLRKHYGQEVALVPPPPIPGVHSGCYLPDARVIVARLEWSLLTPKPLHDPRKPPKGVRYVTATPGPGAWRVDPRTGTLEPIAEIPPGVDRRRIRNLIAAERPAHEPHDYADFGLGRIFFQKSTPEGLHLPAETP